VDANLVENDCLQRQVITPQSDARLRLYVLINISPILSQDAFYQCSLGFAYYRQIRT
jgi:hypothetical protein